MHSIQAALCFIPLLILGAFGSPLPESRDGNGIPQSTYDDLVQYTKYSSAVYQWVCPSPLGNTLVKNVSLNLPPSAVSEQFLYISQFG